VTAPKAHNIRCLTTHDIMRLLCCRRRPTLSHDDSTLVLLPAGDNVPAPPAMSQRLSFTGAEPWVLAAREAGRRKALARLSQILTDDITSAVSTASSRVSSEQSSKATTVETGKRGSLKRVSLETSAQRSKRASSKRASSKRASSKRASSQRETSIDIAPDMTLDELLGEAEGWTATLVNDADGEAVVLRRASTRPGASPNAGGSRPAQRIPKPKKVLHSRVAARIPGAIHSTHGSGRLLPAAPNEGSDNRALQYV